jgi:preprotein translocase subunit SecG
MTTPVLITLIICVTLVAMTLISNSKGGKR